MIGEILPVVVGRPLPEWVVDAQDKFTFDSGRNILAASNPAYSGVDGDRNSLVTAFVLFRSRLYCKGSRQHKVTRLKYSRQTCNLEMKSLRVFVSPKQGE